jgi:hypothetical protein
MFSTNLKRPLVTLAVTAGLLAVAAPAGATTTDEPNASPALNPSSFFVDIGTSESLGVRAAAHLNERGGEALAHAPTGEDSRGHWPS